MKESLEYRGENQSFVNQDNQELLAHGTSDFPMSVHKTRVLSGVTLALYYHWHNELEIMIMLKGSMRLVIGDNEYIVKAGDIAVISPGLPHMAFREGEEDIEYDAILVQMKFLSSQDNDNIHQQYILPTFLGWKRFEHYITEEQTNYIDIRYHADSIVHMYQMELPGYELAIKGSMFQILYYLFKSYSKDDTEGNNYDHRWVRSFLAYIQNNYQNKLTLGDMAYHVNMSEGYFCRLMKKVFHVSPLEFLNRYRVSQAVTLIENTEIKLGDIGLEVGFSNVNRFTESFKKIMSCTPMEYRMKLRN